MRAGQEASSPPPPSPTHCPLCVFPTRPLFSIKLLVSVHSQFEQQIEELFV